MSSDKQGLSEHKLKLLAGQQGSELQLLGFSLELVFHLYKFFFNWMACVPKEVIIAVKALLLAGVPTLYITQIEYGKLILLICLRTVKLTNPWEGYSFYFGSCLDADETSFSSWSYVLAH